MHFLRSHESAGAQSVADVVPNFARGWACVQVKKVADRLEIVPSSISVLKGDARIVRLPDRVKVFGASGKEVKASSGSSYWVTTETFDPNHCLTEIKNRGQNRVRSF